MIASAHSAKPAANPVQQRLTCESFMAALIPSHLLWIFSPPGPTLICTPSGSFLVW